jgi:hypothetical protein
MSTSMCMNTYRPPLPASARKFRGDGAAEKQGQRQNQRGGKKTQKNRKTYHNVQAQSGQNEVNKKQKKRKPNNSVVRAQVQQPHNLHPLLPESVQTQVNPPIQVNSKHPDSLHAQIRRPDQLNFQQPDSVQAPKYVYSLLRTIPNIMPNRPHPGTTCFRMFLFRLLRTLNGLWQ